MVHQYTGPKTSGINLEKCHTTAQHDLGQVVEGRQSGGLGARYRYVKFEDAVTYLAGHVVNLGAAETDYQVTNDISAAMAGYVVVGVVFQTTPPLENEYGWCQISGIADVLIGSAAVIAGDWLKNDGTTDGAADEATAGTDEALVGQAIATIADAAIGKVLLTIRGA